MHPAVRTQADDAQDYISWETGLDCEGDPTGKSVTRQEHKDDADANLLLQRYGVGVPQKQVQFGEDHFELQLQEALAAIAEAKKAYRNLKPEIRRQYPSWQRCLEALRSGKLDLDKIPEQKEPASQKEDAPAPIVKPTNPDKEAGK